MHFLPSHPGRKQACQNEDQSHHLVPRESCSLAFRIMARFLRFYGLIAAGAGDTPFECRKQGIALIQRPFWGFSMDW
jgi:hypothetical protein